MNKLFFPLLFVIALSAGAQDSLITNKVDSVSSKILEDLSIQTKSYENIHVNFNFTFKNESQDIFEEQEGNIKIDSNRFRLEINKQIVISDGINQWIYLKEANEVQIMEYDAEDDMMSPNKLFTIYEQGYKSEYVELKEIDSKKIHIIDLFSIESNAFRKIQLQIDSNTLQLFNIILYDKNGGSFTYLITDFKTNFEKNNNNEFLFNLTDYPDVEVIDLR
jgi:outer membrane lipoprotein-sorting protein